MDGINKLAWSVKLKLFTTEWPWRCGCAHKKGLMIAVEWFCGIGVKFCSVITLLVWWYWSVRFEFIN